MSAAGPAGGRLIAVEREPARVADLWRALEAQNPGQLFQRFDWASAWLDTQGRARGVESAIVLICDSAAAPIALLPLGVRRWRQVRIAEWLGGEHASFNLPLQRDASALFSDAGAAAVTLGAIGRAIGDVDAFALTNQPKRFNGRAHPLAGLSETPLFDHAWERGIGGDGEALITRILSNDARKKLRAKEKRLAAAGEVRLIKGDTPSERNAILAAFLAQRARRFADAGFRNPFAQAGAEEFLLRAAGAARGGPAIRLYGLSAGDRIVAVFGGPQDSARFSGMFTSFDDDPEIARNSPGDILLRHLIAALSRDGLTQFDLGVGDLRYKRAYCDVAMPMFETYLGCTPAGAIVAHAMRAKAIAKRWIKSNPRLLSIARRASA